MNVKNKCLKGNRIENERIEYLRKLGYEVLPRPPRLKFRKQIDYFGYWDIVAYFPKKFESMNGHWLVEQIKSNKVKDLKKLKEIAKQMPKYTACNLVIRIDGKINDWKEINLRD